MKILANNEASGNVLAETDFPFVSGALSPAQREQVARVAYPLGLTEAVRQRLGELSGWLPDVGWLQTDHKTEWRVTQDVAKLLRRPPMFITTTWRAPDPSNEGSYRGSMHLSDVVWLDLDDRSDIRGAFGDLAKVAELIQKLGIPLGCCSLFASGGKGFHIAIPLDAICPRGLQGFSADMARVFPYICREFVMQSLITGSTDMSLYCGGNGKLLRRENIQRDNGAYKVPITWAEGLALDADAYRVVCSEPRPAVAAEPVKGVSIMAASAWLTACKAVTKARNKAGPMSGTSSVILTSSGTLPTTERLRIERALRPCTDVPYDQWIVIGAALKGTGASDALELWIEFSKGHPGFKRSDCENRWPGLRGCGLGALFKIARGGK